MLSLSFKNLVLLLAVLFVSASCQSQPAEFIAVDQVGYHPDHQKQAFLVKADADSFEVIDADNQSVAFSGMISETKKPDEATGEAVSVIDFSELRESGKFYIRIKNTPDIRSHTFRIEDGIYDEATKTILKSYYFHRCGTAVKSGKWSYQVCHLDDAPFYDNPNRTKDVTGGWHDAGDYNKFSVNTALSAGLLLYTFELDPEAFEKLNLGIPESENEIPDLLDEVKWALDWLLKMQRDDGVIYHKVSQKNWTGEFLPHTDPNTRYIFDISSSSTAAFAATAALGARLFAEYDNDYAHKLADAAISAWQFLEQNPQMIPEDGFQNPPDVRGGEYRDHDDYDERIWAAIELYRLTKEPKFLSYFVSEFQQNNPTSIPAISWRNFESLAYHAFLNSETDDSYSAIENRIQQLYSARAQYILNVQSRNNFENLITPKEYYWGSNSVGLAYSFDLIQTYKFTENEEYLQSALDQLHYIFGRNVLNLSQVTGVGSNPVQHPYHQLSEMDDVEEPIPGMLVGGPNNYLHLNDEVISDYPAKNFEDRFKNYLVNETAINYTAILAYVSAYFSLEK